MRDLGFIRFCNDPELACCQYEKRYFSLQTENARLRKVLADIKQEVEWAESRKLSPWADHSAIEELVQIITDYEGANHD